MMASAGNFETLGRIGITRRVKLRFWGVSQNPQLYTTAMYLFISFFVTDFDRKMGARPELAKESLIPFINQKMDFLPNRLSVINK